jgi:hypothetical protein
VIRVHENSPAAFVLALLQRAVFRIIADRALCQAFGKRAHGVKILLAFKWHGYVKPFGTRRLDVCG